MQAVYGREKIESRKSLTLIDEADELKSQSERGKNLVKKNKNSCYSFSSNEPLHVQI
jgi:signal transduction histidine kinase